MRRLNYALWSVLVMFLAVGFTSCTSEDEAPMTEEISDEILAQFTDIGFDVSDIKIINQKNHLNGVVTRGYLLEQDMFVPTEQLKEMINSDFFGQLEQYRTSNLVSSGNYNIDIIGYTGGSYALDNTMRTALQWAVNNYNRLNIGLNFNLSYGTNYGNKDIVVYKVNGGGGGSAGFPSGGKPYKWVQIQSGTSSYGTNVVEHVITHEIGHSVGFRHTDYFNRSISCGSGGNEGTAGVGAIHVPGTPTGADMNSIMLACFSSSEDGEFGSYDITALEYLY
ncbi:M57 family metalloprotease [Ekhidna sp.]|uniref:M57 family metalloprotease n=1 Tax=Ekhidna sp. TaxID=2608089 RepID=UPI0032999BBA